MRFWLEFMQMIRDTYTAAAVAAAACSTPYINVADITAQWSDNDFWPFILTPGGRCAELWGVFRDAMWRFVDLALHQAGSPHSTCARTSLCSVCVRSLLVPSLSGGPQPSLDAYCL